MIFISAYGFNNKIKPIKFTYNPNVIKQNNNDFDYEIPKWVYKNVFKHNKPTKRIKESDYYYLFRNPKL